jgi:hypothetical protein
MSVATIQSPRPRRSPSPQEADGRDQLSPDNQRLRVAPELPALAIAVASPATSAPAQRADRRDHPTADNHQAPVAPELLAAITVWGETLDDLEKLRIQLGNRVAAIERDYGDEIPELTETLKKIRSEEHWIELCLIRVWRKHSLAPWAKQYRGLGEKSIARLIACVGDPADRPNPAKLWAYCGHGDPARKRRKGMTQQDALALGNPRAKRQVWLISTSMLKSGNREHYDHARAKYAERDWTDGHRHAAALRYVGKQFLKDLWCAARDVHLDRDSRKGPDDPPASETLK